MNKKLYRSYKDKMVGGVAAGLAEYFEIDPTLVRIIFVVTLFLGGTGILAYIIMWAIVPEEPIKFTNPQSAGEQKEEPEGTAEPKQENKFDAKAYYQEMDKKREKRRMTAGIILLVLGVLFMADNFLPRIHFGDFWPLILIVAGLAILINSKRESTFSGN